MRGCLLILFTRHLVYLKNLFTARKMESFVKKKIEFLVVDTSAFIKQAALQELGENIVTVPQVIKEVKSKRQLRRLVVLPYDLSVKDAFPENIKFVTEFSKKTGDYASLSAADINTIALTYQLEKEKNGVSHLRSAPICKATNRIISNKPNGLTNIAGFYIPKKVSLSRAQSVNIDAVLRYDNVGVEHSAEDGDSDNLDCKEGNSEIESEKLCDCKNDLKSIKGESQEICKDDSDEKWVEEGDISSEYDFDDDSCWITPNNIEKAKNQIADELEEDFENVKVACLTTDFAMQNVLKQIGLNVISLDGKLIKQLRTFIFRCYGCFKTTSNMTKVFCPNCGNKTLKKVGVSLDADGTPHLHINFRKPLTARGKKYSIPHFKGGKHSNNPIICADQPMPQQRPTHLSRTKNNPLNDDYIAGYSPFVTRDVTSKSALMGIKPHLEMKHWMRKNPNESRKKKK